MLRKFNLGMVQSTLTIKNTYNYKNKKENMKILDKKYQTKAWLKTKKRSIKKERKKKKE